jgi:hypothetical protein
MDIRLVARKVREVIAACIAPQPKQEALVHVPAPTGTWLQVLGAGSGIVRGYHYRCLCSQEYEYGADEAHVSKAHQCEVCKREFSLLRSVDALSTDGSFKSDLANRLGSLAIRRVAPPARQGPRHVEVGNEKVRDPWSGKQDSARNAAFDAGDPGYTNLF